MEKNKTPSNPRMQPFDGIYAIEARSEDFFSLRDHFAGLAMQCLVNRNGGGFSENDANQAYYIATEMLKQREL